MIAGPLIAGGLVYGFLWARARGANSAREDVAAADDPSMIEDYDLSSSLGWPYFFGRGSPSTDWEDGVNGVDCSGYVQMALVLLGILPSDAIDRGAARLADDADPVAVGDQELGDYAYYGGHVMLVCGPPGADGHSPVIGASGGTAATFGTNPDACVKQFDSALYNGDFVCYCRLKEEFRA